MTARRAAPALAAAVAAAVGVLVGCAGGVSDSPRVAPGPAAEGSRGRVNLYAYAVLKPALETVVPAFAASAAGQGVTVAQSYGPSGDQSRKVAAGAPADVVVFSTAPDVSRLVAAGRVAPDWEAGPGKGVPFGSVVTIVVRQGNPKAIADWGDLLRPGIEVVTPNPFSSGSARWNLLAPYAAASEGGRDQRAGLDYISRLVTEHVRLQPKSGREASEAFLRGSGDALLSYESEALFLERAGERVEHVIPPATVRVESPTAVVSTGRNAAAARAFVDYLATSPAQSLLAEAGFRVADPTVAGRFASRYPAPTKEWSIADLGGWRSVDGALFDPDTGSITAIYDRATR